MVRVTVLVATSPLKIEASSNDGQSLAFQNHFATMAQIMFSFCNDFVLVSSNSKFIMTACGLASSFHL